MHSAASGIFNGNRGPLLKLKIGFDKSATEVFELKLGVQYLPPHPSPPHPPRQFRAQ